LCCSSIRATTARRTSSSERIESLRPLTMTSCTTLSCATLCTFLSFLNSYLFCLFSRPTLSIFSFVLVRAVLRWMCPLHSLWKFGWYYALAIPGSPATEYLSYRVRWTTVGSIPLIHFFFFLVFRNFFFCPRLGSLRPTSSTPRGGSAPWPH
jgi:hypothetical protein